MVIPTATYKILYDNKDITRDISDHLISLNYVDKVQGESDELEITLDDKDGFWQNSWYPKKGAKIEATIYNNGLSLPCGIFTIDEISLTGSRDSGDKITIRSLAAGITKKIRSPKTTAHENKTLKQLAEYVATQHSLTVKGSIPDIRFTRITQNYESDLNFLYRLSSLYGLVFSIRGDLLVFENKVELQSKKHILSLDKTDLTDFTFTDKNESTYKSAKVKYHNPEKNRLIDYEASADSDYEGGDDVLEIREPVENKQQAEAIAGSKLNNSNKKEKSANFTFPGNVLVLSGSNVEMTGFGILSGIYHATETAHSINKGDGYVTSMDGQRVNKIESSKHKPKVKKSNTTAEVETGGPNQRVAHGFVTAVAKSTL